MNTYHRLAHNNVIDAILQLFRMTNTFVFSSLLDKASSTYVKYEEIVTAVNIQTPINLLLKMH